MIFLNMSVFRFKKFSLKYNKRKQLFLRFKNLRHELKYDLIKWDEWCKMIRRINRYFIVFKLLTFSDVDIWWKNAIHYSENVFVVENVF